MEAPSAEAVVARLRTQRIRPLADRIQEKGKGSIKTLSFHNLGPASKPKISLFLLANWQR
jgi:hypothetical protein